MLQNKNQYAKEFAELISRNVTTKKNHSINRKNHSGTVDLKTKVHIEDPYYSSEDDLKGRSVIQEIDYQDPKLARK